MEKGLYSSAYEHDALGVGKGAVLLQEGGAGQHHIRKGRGFGDKQVLYHHKGLFQRLRHMADIGVGNHGVFAHDVQELHLVLQNRGDGLGDGIALLAADVQAVSKAVAYLRDHNLYTLKDLDEALQEVNGRAASIRSAIKTAETRMKTITQIFRTVFGVILEPFLIF